VVVQQEQLVQQAQRQQCLVRLEQLVQQVRKVQLALQAHKEFKA
jgi:hypothetical protein